MRANALRLAVLNWINIEISRGSYNESRVHYIQARIAAHTPRPSDGMRLRESLRLQAGWFLFAACKAESELAYMKFREE